MSTIVHAIRDHAYYPTVRGSGASRIEDMCVTCGRTLSSSTHVHMRVTNQLRTQRFWGSSDLPKGLHSQLTGNVVGNWHSMVEELSTAQLAS